MDQREEGKQQPSQKTPSHNNQLDPVESSDNVAPENVLQEQSGTFTTFASLESGSESDSSFDEHDEDSEFFLSQEFESELQFLESEGSNDDDDDDDDDEEMEEDEIDVDELTYEELIELGDFIGREKRGLSGSEICSCLHSYTFHSAESKSGVDLCVICQVEYEEGEALVAIQCEHPYHTDCITKWLQIKKVCPICNTEISAPKIVS
ncbi:E3 ubiquitin ligase BIG BROTHER-related-like [Vigna unguiculata]|uniref:E3 ubiquitin ligase BIG BROTHER-related-like n=1 Tax=Vigna unguiculata TaxID=3917 RepID=UPI00101662EF|nr:E3 ubiquitin ligase BIG BROTHER-related-like [Vigna unguiculata]